MQQLLKIRRLFHTYKMGRTRTVLAIVSGILITLTLALASVILLFLAAGWSMVSGNVTLVVLSERR